MTDFETLHMPPMVTEGQIYYRTRLEDGAIIDHWFDFGPAMSLTDVAMELQKWKRLAIEWHESQKP